MISSQSDWKADYVCKHNLIVICFREPIIVEGYLFTLD